MFTGIVQSQAEVIAINRNDNAIKLKVSLLTKYAEALALGASVAINGVCLTAVTSNVISQTHSAITFDVIDETLRVSNLGKLILGSLVNVERSLKIGDEIGGHMVSGHVHTQGVLVERMDTLDNCQLCFSVEPNLMKYVFAKGFISLNGISLTVGSVVDNSFSVHLIPETLARTNLASISEGESVNIEFDQQTMTIVSTIERMDLKSIIG
jgi:riboflavin synthase